LTSGLKGYLVLNQQMGKMIICSKAFKRISEGGVEFSNDIYLISATSLLVGVIGGVEKTIFTFGNLII